MTTIGTPWHPASDPPQNDVKVIISDKHGDPHIGYLVNGVWKDFQGREPSVLYWTPIPILPERMEKLEAWAKGTYTGAFESIR